MYAHLKEPSGVAAAALRDEPAPVPVVVDDIEVATTERLLSVPLTRQERQLLFEPSSRLNYHLEDGDLVGGATAWRSPVERFVFYVKVLSDIEEQNEGGLKVSGGRPQFLPQKLLR